MSTSSNFRSVSPTALRDALLGPAEIAVIDVREQGLFARKSLLWGISIPYFRLELEIARLVPRLDTPIVLVDADGQTLQAAAERLQRLAYTDIALLEGGVDGWEAAGLEVFQDENVPGKAFGEWIEEKAQTPHIDVRELRRRIASGEDVVIVDGRTPAEFKNFSLPGAFNVPNIELPYRIRELAPKPDTLVVVNCAGRTRSIVGAQTLIDAGIPNPVVALEDGTMAWLLNGLQLEHGRVTELPEPGAAHLTQARAAAADLLQRAGVSYVDDAGLARLSADTRRSLYLLDVRTEEEYVDGHLPGWWWVPGGQLVQGPDKHIGTRGARVVLADWDGVRAPAAAAWLAQFGVYDVHLYRTGTPADLQLGPAPRLLRLDPAVGPTPWIAPASAHGRQRDGAVIIDIDNSLQYRKQHPEGAWFIAPHRLRELSASKFPGKSILLTSRDGVLAGRVAAAHRTGELDVRAIQGGTEAWKRAGLPLGNGDQQRLTGEDDTRYGAYAYAEEAVRHQRFREYLAWEHGLTAQLKRPGGEAHYRQIERPAPVFQAAPAATR